MPRSVLRACKGGRGGRPTVLSERLDRVGHAPQKPRNVALLGPSGLPWLKCRIVAPHMHAAIRGAIPRALLRQVRAATYHQLWWPPHDHPVYVDRLPVWTERGYTDPATGAVLPTWAEALDALGDDPGAGPAHVARFGDQDNIQGLLAGTPGVERAIGYLCKYVTKAVGRTYDDGIHMSSARAAHLDRLAEEVRWLPCAPTCANWRRFGVQPAAAQAGDGARALPAQGA
jgi:hypothetical protein